MQQLEQKYGSWMTRPGIFLQLALFAVAIAFVPVTRAANILWDLNHTSNVTNATLQDFVDAGVTENISSSPVSLVTGKGSGSMTNGSIVLKYISGTAGGTFASVAPNPQYPSALLDDYIFLSSATLVTMRIEGLASALSPLTTYRLYLFGSGNGSNQQARFTFNGVTISNLSAAAPGPSTPKNGRTAVFTFDTGATITNSLDFTWSRMPGNMYAGFNGFAIVAAANPDSDKDGLTIAEEAALGTNPNLADSDLDGSPDGVEVVEGTNPNLNSSVPTGNPVLAGVTNNQPMGDFLNGAFPPVTPSAGAGGSWSWEDAYPSANVGALGELIGMSAEPSSNYVYALERTGAVWRVENTLTANTKTKVLSLSVNTSDNGGLRSVLFHPKYGIPGNPHRNDCFAFYSIFTNNVFYYRLSRFTRDEADGQLKNELVMIQQRSRDRGQHFSGGLAFETNGFLIVTFGDFSYNTGKYPENLPKNQWYQDAQRIDRIFQSAVLRLDVDQQGGSISAPPTRTLQGDTGPFAMPGTTQSCPTNHNFYDVENRSGIGYYIPLDNYFVLNPPPAGVGGTSAAGIAYPAHGPALGERHALGVRNPWRLAVDPEDNEVLLFNVGSNGPLQHEEIDRLVPGGNYGWPFAEGIESDTAETGFNQPPGDYAPVFLGVTNRASPRQMDPLRFYDPTEGVCIVGGVIYRGSKFPSLYGKLIYGDTYSGKVWVLDYKGKNPSNYVNTVLLQGASDIRQIVTDPSGQDILFATGDTIKRLAFTVATYPEPPALLSQAGVFSNLATLAPTAGLIPYTPASPLWSDRADKLRWIALPNSAGLPGVHDLSSEQIAYSDNSEWTFPKGTVFVKQFNIPLDERDPENPLLQKRLETRFLTQGTNGIYYAVTYKWNGMDTDADLLPAGDVSAFAESFLVTNGAGGTYLQTWDFPSRSQCMECHQAAAGYVLGIKSRQLNHHQEYGTNVANQISTWRELGWFNNSPSLTNLPQLTTSKPLDDVAISPEWRVRSYLDSNCSHCHRPGAQSGRATFDVRLTTPTEQAGLINAFPAAGNFGLLDARIIMPQSMPQSLIHLRQATNNPAMRMPPLGRQLADAAALNVLSQWIGSLPPLVNLPPPWTNQDVGPVGLTGNSSHALGTFTLNGAGLEIWNTEDSFQFMHRPLVGDATLTVRVASQENTDPGALAGVMFRQDLSAGSQHVFVGSTPESGISFTWRPIAGSSSQSAAGVTNTAPYWVRLTRSGNIFTAYQSANGTTWTPVGSPQTISMTGAIYAGLAVTAHDSNTLSTAMFDHLLLTGPNVNNPPTIATFDYPVLDENTTSGPVPFDVMDIETPASNLVVTAASSNPALINTGLVLGGSGANRTLTLTPEPNQSGTATITVVVTDAGGLSATNRFQLTVNALAPMGISGTVRDLNTLLPIPGARVTLQATVYHTNTAVDGSFTLLANNGSGLVLVGAHKGHYNASITTNAPATNVTLWLEPVPFMQNSNYAVLAPETCGVCHPNQLAQWQGTPMARAGSNTWVHDTFSGLGTPNGTNGFVYVRDSMLAPHNPNSECAACHQPERWIHTPFTPLRNPTLSADAATVHGVSCEVCHKIANVDTNKINFPGIFPGAVEFSRPTDNAHQVQYGVLGDTDYTLSGLMRPAYQPQLVAEVCAVCHQDANDPAENHTYTGPISEPTYLEWLNSPYSNPQSADYASCVTCHMPPSGSTQVSSLLPLTRSTNSIRSHTIVGTTPEFLENAVDLQLSASLVGGVLQVQAAVTNTHAGHHVPTGVTVRNVILLVEAWRDSDQLALTHTGAQTVHPLGGVGSPAQGYYAGLPGKLYAFVNRDALNNSPVFFTEADSVLFDTRLAAHAGDTTTYSFAVPPGGGPLHVRARLIYRRAWRAIVDAKQWTQTGHGQPLEDIQPPHFGHLMELAEATLTAPTNQPPTANADSITRFVTQGAVFPAANLLTNDTDPDGDMLMVAQVMNAQPGGASLALSNASVRYSPAFGDTNPGSFNYVLNDSRGSGATGLVTVLVQPDPPAGDILSLTAPAGGIVSGTLTGQAGFTYTVQFSGTLNPAVWQKLIVLTADGAGHLEFTDTLSPGQEKRFYRAVRGAMP